MVGFNPEAQASATYNAELSDRLFRVHGEYQGFRIVTQERVDWVQIAYTSETKFATHPKKVEALARDCNVPLLKRAGQGNPISFIAGWEVRPDVFDGRNRAPIGVITINNDLIYHLNGFDYETYLAEEYDRLKQQRKQDSFDRLGIRIRWNS